jgi:hypothetical protein
LHPPEPPLELVAVDVLAALLFSDQQPLVGAAGLLDWRLDGAVTRLLRQGGLSGCRGERLLVRAGAKLQCDWVLLLGAGKRRDCSKALLRSLLDDLRRCCREAQLMQVALALPLDLRPLAESNESPADASALSLQLLFIDDAIMA